MGYAEFAWYLLNCSTQVGYVRRQVKTASGLKSNRDYTQYTGNPPKVATLFLLQNARDIWKCFFFNFFYIENVVSCGYYVLRVKNSRIMHFQMSSAFCKDKQCVQYWWAPCMWIYVYCIIHTYITYIIKFYILYICLHFLIQ